ncbi:hypothetical protein [Nonlabens antarcticus]|uniref:hypothetical protein n=1 Tax=Nonlabens antarcticus TaxID=392714 RepID=UPI0018913F1E|nr:hypothetical protein [Nonlabens antarcticus]
MKQFILLALFAVLTGLSSCKDQDSSETMEESELSVVPNTDSRSNDVTTYEIEEKSKTTSSSAVDSEEQTKSNPTTNVEAGKVITSPDETEKINTAKPIVSKNYKASVLSSDGIILFDSSGRQDKLSFGQSASGIIEKMTTYLGKPSSDAIENNCNGAQVHIVKWNEYISLNFKGTGTSSKLSGWNLQSRDKYATQFKTTSGLTVGKKRSEIPAVSDVKPIKTSLGYLEKTESLNAIFSTSEKDAVLTYLFAGVNCYAIEEGVTPESDKN